ncbi:hypothetical protein RHSIM_Rhsim04G0068800 [Rhododendron simsii]|uniref:Uncharacterized protein n=1 Tax=Rhododendron simsii TaxID=118357 RepID=A0A834H1R9_RHOSS|nr:hypothetical protein RHSIM_Rhsim04G0068800 [Rhododendron simsii]
MKPNVKSHQAKPSFRYFSRDSCDPSISLYLTGEVRPQTGQAFLIQGPLYPASRAAFTLHDVIPVADCLTVKGAEDVINKPLAFEINLHRSVHDTDEQEKDVGIPIRRSLHHPPVLHLEHHQIDPLLVRVERRAVVVLLRMAGAVRGGGAGGGVRAALDGRRAGRGCPGHPGDVDNRAGPAGLLREAAAGAGGGGEGADGGDYWVRAEDLDQGREFRGSCLRGGGVLRAY